MLAHSVIPCKMNLSANNKGNKMQAYKVTCSNDWTGKSKVRTVEAENVLEARCSHKAVSNYMMANAWYVSQVADMHGNVLYQANN